MRWLLCSSPECEEFGIWRPTLRFLGEDDLEDEMPVELELGLRLCDRHKDEVTVPSFLNDEVWSIVCGASAKVGKSPPTRSRTTLGFKRIAAGDA